MLHSAAVTTFLFTDIEGSTRLWECEPGRMRSAFARHDALARKAVEDHHGVVVKTTGDGLHAAFNDPSDGLAATLELQQRLADPAATGGIQLLVRCGLHAGLNERRDNDYFGSQVNRAARDHEHRARRPDAGLASGGGVHSRASAAGVSLRDLGACGCATLRGPSASGR